MGNGGCVGVNVDVGGWLCWCVLLGEWMNVYMSVLGGGGRSKGGRSVACNFVYGCVCMRVC